MVSQFLHGERAAKVAAERLAGALEDPIERACAAQQEADEIRHIRVFETYLSAFVPDRYPMSAGLSSLVHSSLDDGRWDVAALGVLLLVEPLALGVFRAAGSTFHDPLIKRICGLTARDEARHVALGTSLLTAAFADLSSAERAEREDFACEGLTALHSQLLLLDLWPRVGVDVEVGREYALHDPLMRDYRRIVLSRVLRALGQVGLGGPRVSKVAARLDLL
jgi:hypothetical protein